MALKSYADIRKLWDNKISESITLDFKEKLPENKKIAKVVSSFANTEGGYVIFGVEEDNTIAMESEGIEDFGSEAERIEQVITSQIIPHIQGVRVLPVLNPLIKENSKGFIIIDIPFSLNRPHRSEYDKKYYLRSSVTTLGFGEEVIPDSILELMFKRRGEYDSLQLRKQRINQKVLATTKPHVNNISIFITPFTEENDHKEDVGEMFRKLQFSGKQNGILEPFTLSSLIVQAEEDVGSDHDLFLTKDCIFIFHDNLSSGLRIDFPPQYTKDRKKYFALYSQAPFLLMCEYIAMAFILLDKLNFNRRHVRIDIDVNMEKDIPVKYFSDYAEPFNMQGGNSSLYFRLNAVPNEQEFKKLLYSIKKRLEKALHSKKSIYRDGIIEETSRKYVEVKSRKTN